MRPMDFIAMDLIGEFHPPSSQGNRYALTGICMLTGFTWCIPLKSKKAAEVSRAYLPTRIHYIESPYSFGNLATLKVSEL